MKFFRLFSKINKKALFALIVLMLGLTTVPVLARDPMPEGVDSYFQQIFVPAVQSQDVNLQSTVYEIYLSLISAMGESMYECDLECLQNLNNPPDPTVNTGQGNQYAQNQNKPKGLIPWAMRLNTSMIAQPPVSSVDYVAHVGERLHLTSPVYAQAGARGFGYEGLAPARQLWTGFRNIAYLLATIGFVILSFLIMFRIKISAQATISAQQAIFKLVVVFLAITFSYAIAGLILDLLFILTFVVITLFVSTGMLPGNPSAATLQAELLRGNVIYQMGALLGVVEDAAVHINNIINGMILEQFDSGFGPVLGMLSGWTGAGLGFLIIGIAVAYALIRLLFALLFAYLEIIILTILAPLMLLPDIFPGGNSFINWVKRLFANAMVFPTTTFMILLGMAIVGDQETGSTAFQDGIQLPYLGIPPGALQPFLGVGMILLTYKVVDMVKNALKVQGFQYTTAIGTALGYGAGRTAGMVSTAASPRVAFSQAAGRIPGLKGAQKAATQRHAARQEAELRYKTGQIDDAALKTAKERNKSGILDPWLRKRQ